MFALPQQQTTRQTKTTTTTLLGRDASKRRRGGRRRRNVVMIEVILNDRLGKKIRVKCNEDDTIGDLKKLVAAQTGTRPEKIRCVSLSLFRRSGGRKKRPVDTASPTFLRTDDASTIFSLSLKRRRRRRRRRRKGFKSGTRYTRTTSRSTITR